MKEIEDLAKSVFIDENKGRFHTELLFFAFICLFVGIITRIKYLFRKK